MQDGLELLYWKGWFAETVDMALLDDADRIFFSFNCRMDGAAACIFQGNGAGEHVIGENVGTIQYGPGRRGIYRQSGLVENLSIMIRRDLFETWCRDVDPDLSEMLRSGGFQGGHRGGELMATAHLLGEALQLVAKGDRQARHSLWFQAQSMLIIGLFLEARTEAGEGKVSEAQRQRLHKARDRLLSDLSLAPALADLARDTGLSLPSLTRGFRALYGDSPYNLFQKERMQAARRRLLDADGSVASIATEFGYTNTSHFASAFRKQFGIAPGSLKRQG